MILRRYDVRKVPACFKVVGMLRLTCAQDDCVCNPLSLGASTHQCTPGGWQ